MNPWILVSAAVVCLAAVVAGHPSPQYPAVDAGYPSYDAEPKGMGAVMAHHGHKGGGGGGGGGGHGHGKATSYQVSNNWAYHPVKVYVKHHGHHGGGGGGGGGGDGGHKDFVF